MEATIKGLLSALIVILAAVVLVSPVGCVVQRDAQIVTMVKNGADPIAARCALVGADSPAEAEMCRHVIGKVVAK